MGFVVVMTGAAGFIGRALAAKLWTEGELQRGEDSTSTRIDRLVLVDIAPALKLPGGLDEDPRIVKKVGVDLRENESFRTLLDEVATGEDELSVFHLGGIASGDGERDDQGADLALDINFNGTRNIMTALRDRDRCVDKKSRFVFTSTNAVFAPTTTITDDSLVMPRTSYGTAKAMGELLINDWSRRRFLDGRCTRMPAVIPRTSPNASAASAWSDIIAYPASGLPAKVSVPPETSLPVISIFCMMDNLIKLHNVADSTLGDNRVVVMPAIALTLKELASCVAELLAERGLPVPEPLIIFQDDPKAAEIVKTWPPYHKVSRAYDLGWAVDKSAADIVNKFLDGRTLL